MLPRYLLTVLCLVFFANPRVFAETIKIGVSAALTSSVSAWGEDVVNGIKFANRELANDQYEIILEDDKCDPRQAVSIAHKFVDVENIKYTLGHTCSGPLLAAAPIYENGQVIAISATASATSLSNAGDYIFRTWPSDNAAIKKLADYIKSHHKKLAILTEQTDYAEGLLAGMLEHKGNLKIYPEEYTPGLNDFRTLLLRLKKHDVDAIFLNPQGDLTLIPMLQQLKQLNINTAMYAVHYGESEKVLKLAGNLMSNFKFAAAKDADSMITSKGTKLLEKFKSKYPINFAPIVVLTAIESFRALHLAIQSGEDPRTFLYNHKFEGLFGQWHFDSHGDIQGLPFAMKKIVDGKVVTIEE